MNIKHDRNQVLKSGLNLFSEKGYNGLGVDEICKNSGMTKGAFYNAFKSKEQFLLETIISYGDSNVNRIKSEFNLYREKPAIERLQLFYAKMIEVQSNNNFKGCFINNMMSELGIVNNEVAIQSNVEFEKFIDNIEIIVKEAQENGDLKNNITARQITYLLHTTFYGILTIIKTTYNIEQAKKTMESLFHNLKTN